MSKIQLSDAASTDIVSNEPKRQPTVVLIQLVNSKQSTRPFLQSLWKPHVSVPDFGELINHSPFQSNSACQSPITTERLNHKKTQSCSQNILSETDLQDSDEEPCSSSVSSNFHQKENKASCPRSFDEVLTPSMRFKAIGAKLLP